MRHFPLHSIRRKILMFFALLILGILLLGSLVITLYHRIHTSTTTVREETQDIRRIDELRIIFLDFLVLQYADLSLAELEASFARLHQDFIGKLDAYIQGEQAQQTSASREKVALLSQIRDSVIHTLVPQAHAFSLAHERGDENHTALWRQLRQTIATLDLGLEQVVAIHQRLVADALRRAEQGQQRLIGLGFVFLHVAVFTLLGGHLLLYQIIINPLQRLNAAMRRVAHGNFTERVVMQGTIEWSELAMSFNTMAAQLEADASLRRAFYQELETQVAERTRALQAANQELQQTQIRLLEAERIATTCEMTVSVTHEIRQPLNALSINFQMIKRSLRDALLTLDTRVAEHIQLLEDEIERLNDVCTTFMKSAQVSQSARHPMDLAKTIRHVVQLLAYEATAAQVTLHYRDDTVLPPIMADKNHMRQVLINLLLNAIQAQPNGGRVGVSARYEPDPAQIRLRVQDNGPGIAPALLEQIWRPFFTTKAAGTGLGLAIVRRIVWEHGGSIACTSVAGRGTCFQIVLPVPDTCGARAPAAKGRGDAHHSLSS